MAETILGAILMLVGVIFGAIIGFGAAKNGSSSENQ